MNFFEHQDRARRNTVRLIVLLLLAVASLIGITTVLIAVVVHYFPIHSNHPITGFDADGETLMLTAQVMSWELLGYTTFAVGCIVGLGSLYKLVQLGGGGRTVAEAMDGRVLNLDTRNDNEKKILNVVEEMAIASGTPVPPVYLIDDDSINAFAAGYKSQDAVIGVTRGCIDILNRDELQGVIAHEFSHILHGDMRLNIRLVGILHGILLIGLMGYFLMRSTAYSGFSRRRGNSGGAILAVGLGLAVIGYAGTFFGNLIKAAVSRQREFLADASAVQFTRNPTGISGALKKIGGYSSGSALHAARAAEFSHMYFSQGIKSALGGWLATHPALQDRIQRVDPRWDGKFPQIAAPSPSAVDRHSPSASDPASETALGFAPEPPGQLQAAPAATQTMSALDSVGQPSQTHLAYARQFLNNLTPLLREAAHDSFSARALVYSLLLSKDAKIFQAQQLLLRKKSHPAVFKYFNPLAKQVRQLSASSRLPLLELCLPALKSLSPPQYQVFKRNLILLIRADAKVDLFEWSLYRIVIHNLKENKPAAMGKHTLNALAPACQLLLSAMAHTGHANNGETERAYSAGVRELDIDLPLLPASAIKLSAVDNALLKLNQLRPLHKPILLKGLARCVTHDGKVKAVEAELFRALADSLDCPVPPLLPNQKLVN